MTDLRDSTNALEAGLNGEAETGADGTNKEDHAAAVDIRPMSRRLGEKIRTAGKTRGLKLICALLALSSGVATAQGQPGLLAATRDSSAAQDRSVGLAPATTPAPQRLGQSFVGSDRLGITLPLVSNATTARNPLSAIPAQSLRHRGPGVALMIVGAAGVITGLLLEESLITILGAGTGLVGLYLYLR
jgi:hypothetical protein